MIMNSSGKDHGPILLFQKLYYYSVIFSHSICGQVIFSRSRILELIVIDFINLKNTVVD